MEELKNKLPMHKYYALLEILDITNKYDVILRLGFAVIDDKQMCEHFKTIVDKRFKTNLSYFQGNT